MFTGILIDKTTRGYQVGLANISDDLLPDGDVDVNVLYSSLNYKDALAITGKAPIVRQFPMVPGIDLVGEVTISRNAKFKVGDMVLLNGFGVGEQHLGGLATKARLNSAWLIHLPPSLTPRQAMIVGTAGYTAMLSVMALEQHGITPDKGEILVTGANGGVGSFAIAILAKLGYRVVATTGRVEQGTYLKMLGANEILDRSMFSQVGKPLSKERWAGAIDCVGSHTLANVCASMQYGGVVTCCGLAQGMDFPASVAPFILRGITLVGIDSVKKPIAQRQIAWQRLSELISVDLLNKIATDIHLSDAIDYADKLINGEVRGRIVVQCGD